MSIYRHKQHQHLYKICFSPLSIIEFLSSVSTSPSLSSNLCQKSETSGSSLTTLLRCFDYQLSITMTIITTNWQLWGQMITNQLWWQCASSATLPFDRQRSLNDPGHGQDRGELASYDRMFIVLILPFCSIVIIIIIVIIVILRSVNTSLAWSSAECGLALSSPDTMSLTLRWSSWPSWIFFNEHYSWQLSCF